MLHLALRVWFLSFFLSSFTFLPPILCPISIFASSGYSTSIYCWLSFPVSDPPFSPPLFILWDLQSPHFHSTLSSFLFHLSHSLSHHLCSQLLFSTFVSILLFSPILPFYLSIYLSLAHHLCLSPMVTPPEILHWIPHWLASLYFPHSLGWASRCLTGTDSQVKMSFRPSRSLLPSSIRLSIHSSTHHCLSLSIPKIFLVWFLDSEYWRILPCTWGLFFNPSITVLVLFKAH